MGWTAGSAASHPPLPDPAQWSRCNPGCACGPAPPQRPSAGKAGPRCRVRTDRSRQRATATVPSATRSYFLQFDGPVAAKPYVLIAWALARNTKVAVAKLAWHGRERLVLLRVRDDALVAHVLKWDDEFRDPSGLAPKDVTVADPEIDEALQLVDSMTTDDISGYRDEYRQALEAVIEAKSEGRQPPKPSTEAEEPGGQVVDLMAAL
ncbi:Ku protein [Streptomyces mirabilis]